jgi:hypothetical protein
MTKQQKILVLLAAIAITLATIALATNVTNYYQHNTVGLAATRMAQTFQRPGLWATSLGIIVLCGVMISTVNRRREAGSTGDTPMTRITRIVLLGIVAVVAIYILIKRFAP